MARRPVGKVPNLIRPIPNRAMPSLIPEEMPLGAGETAPVGQLIRNPRGHYSVFPNTGNGKFQQIVGADMRRCYLEIQNKSSSAVLVSFGNNAAAFKIEPLGTWHSPVAPTNEIWLMSPMGAECVVVLATD